MTTDVQHIRGLEALADARVREVVVEACCTIRQAFPEAEYRVAPNPDYRGAIIDAYTESEDAFSVLDLVNKRLVDLLVEEDIDVQVVHQHRVWLPSR